MISRRLSFKAFFIILIACVLFIPSSSTEIAEPIRDGDYIYIEDSKAYLKGTYSTTHGQDIEHWAMTKQFTGDCDMAIGFDGEVAWPTKILLEDQHYVYWNTNESKIFYYATNFAPTTDTQDYGNWYNSLKYKFDHKIYIGYDNDTNESVWQDVIGTVAYFDSQTNDGTNYTITWHTEHSRLEQCRDISNRILSNPIEYEYDGKNLWFVTKDIPMTAGVMRKVIIEMDGKMEWGTGNSYKYDIIWKPSHQSIAEAKAAGNLYVLDPLWNSSYDVRLKMPINNTAGAGALTYYQIGVNVSSYDVNASSMRCYNRTSGAIISHWNESVVGGNVYKLWTNNTAITSGWDENYYCAWQSTPTYISTSDGDATFEHFDGFENGVSDWTCNAGTFVASTSKARTGSHSGFWSGTLGDNRHKGIFYDFGTKTSDFILEFSVYKVIDGMQFVNFGTSSNAPDVGYTPGEFYAKYTTLRNPGTGDILIDPFGVGWTDYTIIEHPASNSFAVNISGAHTYSNSSLPYYSIADPRFVSFYDVSSASNKIDMYVDNVRIRKYTLNEPSYEDIKVEHYSNSLHYNTTQEVNNTIYSNPAEIALNRSAVTSDDINDTAGSTGISYIQITNKDNTASIVRNFTILGDDLDWYQAENITGSYSMKNSSGTIQTVADRNFTVNLVAGNYWIEQGEISIVLLSQTPSIIYTNSTGCINISYGVTHSSSGLDNTSVSFIYRNYDWDLSDSNHSIRPPTNDLASEWNFDGRILRAANRNETPGLNFENNATITGGDTYTWSGLDENSTKLTIVPVNSTYTKVYINATVHCIMPQMWYLDRTDQQQSTKTQLPIHKTQNVLIKFWNFEIFKGNYNFLGVGYTDTSLSSNPALWPSDANPVNFYYVNSSYDPATGGDPITSGYAVYMGSLNASGWVDHVYNPHTNSNYVRGFIDNNYLHTVVNTTNISYLYFTSNTESSKPYYINMTNVASSTNRSFANTNTLWTGNTPPYTPRVYTPNFWVAFMKLNMSLDHKLYAADNNDLWGSSSMNRTNITQALFPPTNPVIDHFHFLGETDYDMDGVYYGNFSIGCGVSTDPDGGDVTHNLTLHYDNGTFVTIINNTFTDKDITHNGVYFDVNFSSIPYYSDDVNYTLRLIANDDESESVTVWLGVNFTLSITPIITLYTPSTPVTTIQHDTQEFTINVSQIVNVTWYIDGSVVSTVNNTNYSTYSNSTAPIGTYNVTAHVENVNGTRQQVWEWIVEDPVFAALLQLQADIDKMKRTQTIIQALIFLVIGVIVGVVAQRRRFNDEDSEKPIESKNN